MIVIVDYGMGNLGSIANMLRRVRAETRVTANPDEVGAATKLILPGVGAFDHGMRSLRERGLVPVLEEQVLTRGTPILGLCLGMQLFTRSSEEGSAAGLGWIDAQTVRFRFEASEGHLKIPHMGWNSISPRSAHPLLAGLAGDSRFYFVHSYHVTCAREADIVADAHYGRDFPAVVGKDNILGAQFHPEKSHRYGMLLLRNFAERV